MSVLHYFSKDSNKRAQFIFNTIAPVYAKVDKGLQDNYKESILSVQNEISIKDKSILDIGTGTGAWASMFLKYGANKVNAIDFSDKMLAVAKEKHPDIVFEQGNAENLVNYKDNTFDIVTASFVIHGVKKEQRFKMISEMKRVAREALIIHDFVGKTPLFIKFLEFLEQSDYKNFKHNFYSELKEITNWNTKVIKGANGSGLYIATK